MFICCSFLMNISVSLHSNHWKNNVLFENDECFSFTFKNDIFLLLFVFNLEYFGCEYWWQSLLVSKEWLDCGKYDQKGIERLSKGSDRYQFHHCVGFIHFFNSSNYVILKVSWNLLIQHLSLQMFAKALQTLLGSH